VQSELREQIIEEDLLWPAARHIADNDPARVLGEVAALRAVVDLHAPGREIMRCDANANFQDITAECRACRTPKFPAPAYPCATLRALAAMWADHSDYKESWKP
jgi:hypothetical protein